MFAEHLSLTNFRNYHHLELELPPHVVVIQGDNTQGKTNLLEAIYVLAMSKSHRTSSDRELINQIATKEELPIARLTALVHRIKGSLKVEIALKAEGGRTLVGERDAVSPEAPVPPIQKRIRVNGIVRRTTDLVGQVNVVMFTAQDIDVINGAPALRRRYLDQINSQIDFRYLRFLQRYHRVLMQRNHLLRLLQQHQASPDQLEFWDKELVESGSYLITQRQHIVAALRELAGAIQEELSGGMESLRIVYVPSIGEEEERSPGEIESEFWKELHQNREKEITQGMSLFGPHRDDLYFDVNGMDMGIYGSRGQQRTIALSLKLAEAKYIYAQAKDHPILLLDDVLSELDRKRRHYLLEFILPFQQVLITTTDLDCFESSFLTRTLQLRVNQGNIERI